MLPCRRCSGEGGECQACDGSGMQQCDNRGCEEPAVGFDNNGKALCEDCLSEWVSNYTE